MNTIAPLDQLDATAAERAHFSFVEPSRLEAGGIDPLGMAALNLELMSSALPGINNTTSRIRVYSFTAWAWWRAREAIAAVKPSGMADAAELQALVDRWEVLFVWSNMRANTNSGLPGRLKLGGALPKSGAYRFGGTKWDKLRAERHQGQTALQAAVNYGPSTRALLWIVRSGSGTLFPSEQAMPVVKAFDDIVNTSVPPRLLQVNMAQPEVSLAEVDTLHAAWNADDPSPTERDVFRHMFYDIGSDGTIDGDHKTRARTLDLFRSALEQADGSVSEDDFRRILASWRFANGNAMVPPDGLADRAMLWSAIQARQLQRQALEAMLCWIEHFIQDTGGVATADAMVDAADRLAREAETGADAGNLGAYLDEASQWGGDLGWPAACAWHPETDIFDLIDDLGEAVSKGDWASVPPLALRSIAFCEAIVGGLREAGIDGGKHSPLVGNPDRLPLGAMSKRLASLRGHPIREFWREVILAWVLAQHVRWSVVRNGDGTQRLRVTLDEGGWVRLRPDNRTITPMRDRLTTSLSLASECGLIVRVPGPTGQPPLYAAAG